MENIPYFQSGPYPGKKASASPKMEVLPLFPIRVPPFQPGHVSATASLCGDLDSETLKVSPGPFSLRRLLSCPGDKKRGLDNQRIWR